MSIEPMNASESPAAAPAAPAGSEGPQTQQNPAEKLRKRIVFGFTGTVVIGFALAGWYVGGRISASERPRPAVAASAPLLRPVAATPAGKAAAKPAATQTPAVEAHSTQPAAAPPPKPVVSPAPVLEAHAAKATAAAAPSGKPVANAAPVRQASPAPAAAAAKPAFSPVPENARPASPAQPSWSVVEPRPREKYLQLAALGRRTTTAYLQELQAKGFRPVVGPGPSDGIYRILVGPFSDKTALEQAQNTLHAAGIDPFVRAY